MNDRPLCRPSMTAPVDCSGLCFPAPPGASTDQMMALAVETTGRDAMALVDMVLKAGGADEDGLLSQLAPLLVALGPARRARLFASSLARLDTVPGSVYGEFSDPRPPAARARAILRHVLGHADGPELTIVLRAGAQPEGGFVLPHLAARLTPDPVLPIALRQDSRSLRIVRGDGASVTLPHSTQLPPDFRHPLLAPMPRAAGFVLLNDAPEVLATFGGFGFAGHLERAVSATTLEAGVALLRRCWPEAHAALIRHLDAIVLLSPRGFERSHTPATLRGAILLTASTASAVGDLLCHEASHLRMLPFLDRDPLITVDPELDRQGFTSPWRPDKRPIRGLLLGVHAFLNVCGFYRRLFDDPLLGPSAIDVFARQRRKVLGGLRTLQTHGRPTRLGSILMAEFEAASAALASVVAA